MESPCCKIDLELRGRSRRKSELLLTCPSCKSKWQCREGKYSHPYQVKKKSTFETKSIHVSGRICPSKCEKLIREFGSFQKFIANL